MPRITNIKVTNLFGLYTHNIELFLDDRITIIHGPNGIGKTILLKMISSFFSADYYYLMGIPFNSLEITLDSNQRIIFSQETETNNGKDAKRFELVLFENDLIRNKHVFKNHHRELRGISYRIERYAPWIRRIGRDLYYDSNDDNKYNSMSLMVKYKDLLPDHISRVVSENIEWMAEITKLITIKFIEAQRLYTIDQGEYGQGTIRFENKYINTVNKYADDLAKRISLALSQYAAASQSLDQSFPQRLISDSGNTLNTKDLKEKMTVIEGKRSKLRNIGLIDDDMPYPFDIASLDNMEESKKSVMSLYANDTERKLDELSGLAERIDMLLKNINSKYIGKEIKVNSNEGIIVVTNGGDILPLKMLSSGEQHELIVMYDLLFRIEKDNLVLIDEPELSLHIIWQKKFIDDLLEIVNAAKYDVIIATHSPFIAGDRNDLLVQLCKELS